MAKSHFDNDFMRFLHQTAEYFEIDEVDHVISREETGNKKRNDSDEDYSVIEQFNSIGEINNHSPI